MSSTRTWTKPQLDAIEHRGSDLLLSAAAGSGKTAVLTARLIRLLTSPDSDVKPSEVLAVTFTNAASAEMRDRLFSAALELVRTDPSNARARELVASIASVKICTIHSFCLSAIKPYFARLGLPSDFRVADETESEILRRQAMSETVSEYFDSVTDGGEDFVFLADTLLTARDESSLDEILLSLARTLGAKGVGAKELSAYAENLEAIRPGTFWSSFAAEGIREYLHRFASFYSDVFNFYRGNLAETEAVSAKYLPECEDLYSLAERLQSLANGGDYEILRSAMCGHVFPRLPSVKAQDQTDFSLEFKAYRDLFKKEFSALRDKFFSSDEADILRDARRTASLERALAAVLGSFSARFTEKKRERGILDFNDIEIKTAELFIGSDGNPTPEAQSVAEKYKCIFIDEYQDTSRIQDAIFRAISTGAERFMVGDIKQSIYSFRSAEPEIFANYREAFSHGDGGSYIFMSDNFRSSENVIRFANAVSGRIFPFGKIPYTEEDELRRSRNMPDADEPCELVLIDKAKRSEDDAEGGGDTAFSEAEYTARRIKELLESGTKPDGAPVRPGDIAILLRTNAGIDEYSSALEALGIRTCKSVKSDIFSKPEVMTLLCILNAVSNPVRDIYLAGAMKSCVFGFTLDETVKIRLAFPDCPLYSAVCAYAENGDALAEKCASFISELDAMRDRASFLPAGAFVRSVIKTLDLEVRLSDKKRSIRTVRRSLRELHSLAVRAGQSGFCSLFQFLRYTDRLISDPSPVSAAQDEGEDAVSIMSIHASKGLEFPICFLCRCSAELKAKDASESLMFDPVIGIASRLPDRSGLVRCDNVLRRAAAADISRKALEDEMRILYVAMTRARERLIVTAAVKDPSEYVNGVRAALRFDGEYTVLGASSYLSWILPALLSDGDGCGVKLVFAESAEENAVSDEPIKGMNEAAEEENSADDLREVLGRRFEFRYPKAFLCAVPAKLTVSRLYPEILDEDAAAEADSVGESAVVFDDEAPAPGFISGKSGVRGSDIGSATHVFMQFCDFERFARSGAEDELCRLTDDGFISRKMAEIVDIRALERFRESTFFGRMRRAVRMEREFRFNSARAAKDFTADPELKKLLEESGTELIVQGVVDAVFEEADQTLVLVDYKTDRFTREQLRDPAECERILTERHSNQLTYYRDICGEIFGRKIDETYIYSLSLGREILIY